MLGSAIKNELSLSQPSHTFPRPLPGSPPAPCDVKGMPPYAIPAPFIAALARAPVSRPGSGTRYGTWRFFGGRGGPSGSCAHGTRARTRTRTRTATRGCGALALARITRAFAIARRLPGVATPPRRRRSPGVRSSHAPHRGRADPGRGRQVRRRGRDVAGVAAGHVRRRPRGPRRSASAIDVALTQLRGTMSDRTIPRASAAPRTGYSIRRRGRRRRSCNVAPRFVDYMRPHCSLCVITRKFSEARLSGRRDRARAWRRRQIKLCPSSGGARRRRPGGRALRTQVGGGVVSSTSSPSPPPWITSRVMRSSAVMRRWPRILRAGLARPRRTAAAGQRRLVSAVRRLQSRHTTRASRARVRHPTGACLIAAFGNRCENWPGGFALERCAYGAGTKWWADRPNLLRLVLGTRGRKSSQFGGWRAPQSAPDVISGDGETTD